jgi:hypothetical protein
MVTQERLQELYEKGKQSGVTLPPEIITTQTTSVEGYQIQIFHHEKLGEIGHIVIVPRGDSCQVCYEVLGDLDDPMTRIRTEIFTPIAKQIIDAMDSIIGLSTLAEVLYNVTHKKERIASKIFPCTRCNKGTAMIIFADDAKTEAALENCARKMYSTLRELNIPTWIVGPEQRRTFTNNIEGTLTLKVWPDREEMRIIPEEELNQILDQLMHNHCRGKK